MKLLRSLILTAAAIAMMLAAMVARADTLKLKDGRTLEGTVTKEVDGYIWFKYKVGELEQEKLFAPADIIQLIRTDPATASVPAP
ncbi:MAG: hypothetical protein L6Q35_07240, partial [Phycisphaerales bacterium]|nr:hypothetical protein [Phycisphaerales bacterium]